MAFDPRKSIFGWTAGEDGSGFYRIQQPLATLTAESPGDYLTSWGRLLPANRADFDVVIGQRVSQADEQATPAHTFLKLASDYDQLLVYELDDDIFHVAEDSPAYAYYSQNAVQENVKTCARLADLVTVSTEPLAEIMRQFNPNTVVLPNFIEEDLLTIPRPRNPEVIVGWAGSHTHKLDFKTTGEALDRLMVRNPDVRFMTIGANYAGHLPKNRVTARRWVPSVRKVYRHIAQFDIGMAPLVENVFNESKSYIKALEYAALGIPCVATKVYPYAEFIEHGVTGFLARTEDEWYGYLALLVNDDDLRRKMGAEARKRAKQLTIQGNIGMYERAYA